MNTDPQRTSLHIPAHPITPGGIRMNTHPTCEQAASGAQPPVVPKKST